MVKAAEDLQALGQEIQVTVAWKGKVKAAGSVITGGQKTIAGVALPSFLSPLDKNVHDTATECADIVAKLPDVDALTIKAVSDATPQLQACVRKLRLFQNQLESL